LAYAFVARLDNTPVFTQAQVKNYLLVAEIKVISDPGTQTTFLVYIASPQPKSHPIWQELYQIQKDVTLTSTASPR
jgi:hypothetical protein